ncbi:MAG: AAA family ATPase [Planctomycetaceae bacterium]
MYEKRFGLHRKPFQSVLTDRDFYQSEGWRDCRQTVLHALRSDLGVAVLTGVSGVGKSVTLEAFRRLLEVDSRTLLVRGRTVRSTSELFYLLHRKLLKLQPPSTPQNPNASETIRRWELIERLERVADFWGPLILLLDDAHLLQPEVFAELRALLEEDVDGRRLMRLMIAGPLALEERLAEQRCSDFSHSIRTHVVLQPLRPRESVEYLNHQLDNAGGKLANVMQPEAIELMITAADGIPRCLNLLADESLMLCAEEDSTMVTRPVVLRALERLQHLPYPWNVSLVPDGADVDESDFADVTAGSEGGVPELAVETTAHQFVEFGADPDNDLADPTDKWDQQPVAPENSVRSSPTVFEFGGSESAMLLSPEAESDADSDGLDQLDTMAADLFDESGLNSAIPVDASEAAEWTASGFVDSAEVPDADTQIDTPQETTPALEIDFAEEADESAAAETLDVAQPQSNLSLEDVHADRPEMMTVSDEDDVPSDAPSPDLVEETEPPAAANSAEADTDSADSAPTATTQVEEHSGHPPVIQQTEIPMVAAMELPSTNTNLSDLFEDADGFVEISEDVAEMVENAARTSGPAPERLQSLFQNVRFEHGTLHVQPADTPVSSTSENQSATSSRSETTVENTPAAAPEKPPASPPVKLNRFSRWNPPGIWPVSQSLTGSPEGIASEIDSDTDGTSVVAAAPSATHPATTELSPRREIDAPCRPDSKPVFDRYTWCELGRTVMADLTQRTHLVYSPSLISEWPPVTDGVAPIDAIPVMPLDQEYTDLLTSLGQLIDATESCTAGQESVAVLEAERALADASADTRSGNSASTAFDESSQDDNGAEAAIERIQSLIDADAPTQAGTDPLNDDRSLSDGTDPDGLRAERNESATADWQSDSDECRSELVESDLKQSRSTGIFTVIAHDVTESEDSEQQVRTYAPQLLREARQRVAGRSSGGLRRAAGAELLSDTDDSRSTAPARPELCISEGTHPAHNQDPGRSSSDASVENSGTRFRNLFTRLRQPFRRS